MMDDLGRRLTAPELFIREFPPAAIPGRPQRLV